MDQKIKGKLFVKKGAYFLADDEADLGGLKRLFRSTENLIPVKGPVKNGEIIIDNAYYDMENDKILVEIDCKDK